MEFSIDLLSVSGGPVRFPLEFADAVRNGDTRSLRNLMSSTHILESMVDSEYNLMVMPVVYMSLCSLAAREGGLPEERALEIGQRFREAFEAAGNLQEVTITISDMMMEYAEAVFFQKLLSEDATLVQKCNAYISLNIEHKIYMEELAEYCGYSISGMEHAYKKATGHSLTETVRVTRLEKAKRLLETTSMSSAAISRQLCFSTQSYFINLFKKEYGVTPKEYRASLHS